MPNQKVFESLPDASMPTQQTAAFMPSLTTQTINAVAYLNLQIEIEGTDQKTMIKNQRATFDERGNLLLSALIEDIKQNGFDDLNGAQVKYYSQQDNVFVFVGKDPVPADRTIPVKDLSVDYPLRLEIRLSQGNDAGSSSRKPIGGQLAGQSGYKDSPHGEEQNQSAAAHDQLKQMGGD